jgi:hypothetical protein
MSITDLEIMNMALATLGESRLSALTGTDKRVEAYRVYYTHTVEMVLTEMGLRFSICHAELSQLATCDIPGYEYAYTFPASALLLRSVNDSLGNIADKWDVVRDTSISNRIIVTNLDDAHAVYIKNVSPTVDYTAHVIEAIKYKLAAEMAVFLTDKEEKRKSNIEMYEMTKMKAKGLDNAQQRIILPETSTYTDAR